MTTRFVYSLTQSQQMALADLIIEHILWPAGTQQFVDVSTIPEAVTTSADLLRVFNELPELEPPVTRRRALAEILSIWRERADVEPSLKRECEVAVEWLNKTFTQIELDQVVGSDIGLDAANPAPSESNYQSGSVAGNQNEANK